MPTLDDGQELVSVVIPAYNAELTVGETLASALAQTYRNLDIIVVDDGSTDDTGGVVEAVAGDDARVRLLRQTNRGARNRGIIEARGDLIAILDADDLWHPTKIAKQVMAFRHGEPYWGWSTLGPGRSTGLAESSRALASRPMRAMFTPPGPLELPRRWQHGSDAASLSVRGRRFRQPLSRARKIPSCFSASPSATASASCPSS